MRGHGATALLAACLWHSAVAGQCTQSYSLPPGWNLVSLPCDVVDPSVQALFPGAISLFRWTGSRYQIDSLLVPGQGYWLNLAEPDTVRVTVTGPAPSSTLRAVAQGWTLIGPLGDGVELLAWVRPEGGFDGVFAFAGGVYVLASAGSWLHLDPGRGYWLNATSAVALDLAAVCPCSGHFGAGWAAIRPGRTANLSEIPGAISAFLFAGSWQQATTLDPATCYLVKFAAPGDVDLCQ